MTQLDVKERTEATTAHARWRNVYWLGRRRNVSGVGLVGPGRFAATYLWPSRAMAEAMALSNRHIWEPRGDVHLGAFPVP